MRICGSCLGFSFACQSWRCPHRCSPVSHPGNPTVDGLAELRLAVVSPFLDRLHGTERCIVEQLERLAARNDMEIHVYSQRIEDLNDEGRECREPCSKEYEKSMSELISGRHHLIFL